MPGIQMDFREALRFGTGHDPPSREAPISVCCDGDQDVDDGQRDDCGYDAPRSIHVSPPLTPLRTFPRHVVRLSKSRAKQRNAFSPCRLSFARRQFLRLVNDERNFIGFKKPIGAIACDSRVFANFCLA